LLDSDNSATSNFEQRTSHFLFSSPDSSFLFIPSRPLTPTRPITPLVRLSHSLYNTRNAMPSPKQYKRPKNPPRPSSLAHFSNDSASSTYRFIEISHLVPQTCTYFRCEQRSTFAKNDFDKSTTRRKT